MQPRTVCTISLILIFHLAPSLSQAPTLSQLPRSDPLPTTEKTQTLISFLDLATMAGTGLATVRVFVAVRVAVSYMKRALTRAFVQARSCGQSAWTA